MSSLLKKSWLSMWIKPRETIRNIVEVKPRYGLWILSFFYGWPMTLQIFAGSMPFSTLIIASIIVAPIVGCLGFLLTSSLLFITGRWFNGQAPFSHVLTCVSWSNITSIVSLISWAWLILTFRETIFNGAFQEAPISNFNILIMLILSFAQIIVAVWTLVLMVFSLSVVQKISVGRAVLNLATAVLLVVAVVGVFLALIQNVGNVSVG